MTSANTESSDGKSKSAFNSYAEFLECLAVRQPQYEWLSEFFAHVPTDTAQETNIFVADSENGCLVQKLVEPELLQECPPSVKTRLILIDYEDAWSIDRDILDRVSFALDLPPYYLWQHFDHEDLDIEPSAPSEERESFTRTRVRSSQMFSLEIGTSGLVHLSFLLLTPSATRPTSIALMFARNPWELKGLSYEPLDVPGPRNVFAPEHIPVKSFRTWTEAFKESLLWMDPSHVHAADTNPYEYACQFAYLYLGGLESEFRRPEMMFELSDEVDNSDSEFIDKMSASIQGVAAQLDVMVDHFSGFLAHHQDAATAPVHQVIDDYKALQKRADKLKSYIRDLASRHVSIMALRESKKSIEQADSVGRLTLLAYIFLPLSFSASLFGMNVRELQHTRLPAFVITAIVTTAISLLMLWIIGKFMSMSLPPRRYMKDCIMTLLLLSLRTPNYAFWLILFMATHSYTQLNGTMYELGLYAALLHGEKFNPPRDRFTKIKTNKSASGRFWLRKIEEIAVFTGQENWKYDYFWNRLFAKLKLSRSTVDRERV